MDIGSGRRHREVRFTVIRHFQPVRIETELLAQVFEIVDRGVGDRIGRSKNVAVEASPFKVHYYNRTNLNVDF